MSECTCGDIGGIGGHDPLCPLHGLAKGLHREIAKERAVRRPRAKSDKQKIREAFLAGIKAERIRSMFLKWRGARCEGCGEWAVQQGTDTDEAGFIEVCMSQLDGHHRTARTKGAPYKNPNEHGVDSPVNIQLLCRSCHQAEGPAPRFGEAQLNSEEKTNG